MACVCAKSLQSCLTHCDPMDCSLPGFSVHGIFPARILEWVAIFSSRGSSPPRDRACVSCIGRAGSLPLVPPGKPQFLATTTLLYVPLSLTAPNSSYKWNYTAIFNCPLGLCMFSIRQWHPTPVLFVWKIPWTEEPGGLQSMGSPGIRHD